MDWQTGIAVQWRHLSSLLLFTCLHVALTVKSSKVHQSAKSSALSHPHLFFSAALSGCDACAFFFVFFYFFFIGNSGKNRVRQAISDFDGRGIPCGP